MAEFNSAEIAALLADPQYKIDADKLFGRVRLLGFGKFTSDGVNQVAGSTLFMCRLHQPNVLPLFGVLWNTVSTGACTLAIGHRGVSGAAPALTTNSLRLAAAKTTLVPEVFADKLTFFGQRTTQPLEIVITTAAATLAAMDLAVGIFGTARD